MYYKNCDYTARAETCADGTEKYYIQFHSQADAPKVEVDVEIFNLYRKEFSKPLERQRNERRRHICACQLETCAIDGELEPIMRHDVDAILSGCTQTQQRRFKLYIQGYAYLEVARLERCHESTIRESVSAVLKKMKIYFS